MGGRPVASRPAHEQKLANEFMLYTDSEAIAEGLGGWDEGACDEPACVKEHRLQQVVPADTNGSAGLSAMAHGVGP